MFARRYIKGCDTESLGDEWDINSLGIEMVERKEIQCLSSCKSRGDKTEWAKQSHLVSPDGGDKESHLFDGISYLRI